MVPERLPERRRYIDITRPLEKETAAWPGDVPFALEWTERLAEGGLVNLSFLRFSPHVGTHADAPLHVREGALGIDSVDLEPYLGPARVLDVAPGSDGLIPASVFDGIDLANPPRLLLRTGTDPDPHRWPDRFAALSLAAATRLVRGGSILVGMDTPGVDPRDSTELPAHHLLLDGGLAWLESLDLRGAAPGLYTLIALPLRIRGGDAGPVRAILVP